MFSSIYSKDRKKISVIIFTFSLLAVCVQVKLADAAFPVIDRNSSSSFSQFHAQGELYDELVTVGIIRRGFGSAYRGRAFGNTIGKRLRAPKIAPSRAIKSPRARLKNSRTIRYKQSNFTKELNLPRKQAQSNLRKNLKVSDPNLRVQRILPSYLNSHPVVSRAAKGGFNANGSVNGIAVPKQYYRSISAERSKRVKATLDGLWSATKHKNLTHFQYARVLNNLNRKEKVHLKRIIAQRSSSSKEVAGSIRNVNPTKGKKNCVNCAIATDATLAGRPATALPGQATKISVLAKHFGSKFRTVTGKAEIERIMRSSGHGSRGIVFGGRGESTGHVFNVVNQNGVIRFLDGQVGGGASFEGFTSFRFLPTN